MGESKGWDATSVLIVAGIAALILWKVAFSQGQDAGQEAGAFSGRLEGAECQRIVDDCWERNAASWELHYGRPSSTMSDLDMSGIVHVCSNYASEQVGTAR